MDHVANLHKALLIMHAPTDDTVGIDNATRIFVAAKHPKSFVSLAGADHLLSDRRDAAYVADIIAAWATRYVDPTAAEQIASKPAKRRGRSWFAKPATANSSRRVSVGPHRIAGRRAGCRRRRGHRTRAL